MTSDAALDALLLPLNQGLLTAAPDTLFLRAREGAGLHARGQRDALTCVQPFKPWDDALERAGFDVASDLPSRTFDQVWLLPPRQREEARALIAQAFDSCEPGGVVVASVANDEGAKAIEGDFKKLAGALDGTLSKFHCRVFWAKRDDARIDADVWAQWRKADAPRSILEGRFVSRPGVFAWNRVDVGSELLAEHLPSNVRGAAADLGAGWGFLSDALLTHNPGITTLDAFEADARALELARQNLAAHADRCDIHFHWHDVTAGLPAGRKYDVIVSNPPFHDTGKASQPEIGKRFLQVAAEALAPRGTFWLVANAHLPYEALLAERFVDVRVVVSAKGYKVFEARGVKR